MLLWTVSCRPTDEEVNMSGHVESTAQSTQRCVCCVQQVVRTIVDSSSRPRCGWHRNKSVRDLLSCCGLLTSLVFCYTDLLGTHQYRKESLLIRVKWYTLDVDGEIPTFSEVQRSGTCSSYDYAYKERTHERYKEILSTSLWLLATTSLYLYSVSLWKALILWSSLSQDSCSLRSNGAKLSTYLVFVEVGETWPLYSQ